MLPQTGSPPMEQNANRELEHIDWIQLQAALGQQLARHQVTPAFPSDTHTYSRMTFRKCVYFPPDRSLRGDRVSKCQNFTPAWRSIRFLLASTIFLSHFTYKTETFRVYSWLRLVKRSGISNDSFMTVREFLAGADFPALQAKRVFGSAERFRFWG